MEATDGPWGVKMKLERLHRRSFQRLSGFAAGCLVASAAVAQTSAALPGRAARSAASATDPVAIRKASPYRVAAKITPKAQTYYVAAWGVDKLRVSSTSSGNLIRFTYRVTDPRRAKALSAKTSPPYLVGQKNNVVLQVPVMEKIGQLRQTADPVAGQEYWMVFSNKGNHIKPGDRVNVMIGSFHAEGLVVEGS
jgi:hypothetical protein